MERSQILLYVGFSTLAIVIGIAVLLLCRGGRSKETADTLRSIEGMRAQNSAEHGALEALARDAKTNQSWLRAQWERFRLWPESRTPEKPK